MFLIALHVLLGRPSAPASDGSHPQLEACHTCPLVDPSALLTPNNLQK
jgi:hypothetical protein